MRAFSLRPSASLAWLLSAMGIWSLADVTSVAAQKCLEPGFRVDLIAAFPEIEHPSVVTCDDEGNLFVGEDPMDMRGPTTKEFDRVLRLTIDESGKVTRKTVFCEGLSAVFGLVWHEGALYVMHAPHYSRFRDLDGDGVADERVDLADGFGPPAGIYGFNDHIVTGTRRGLDGRIYISIGDKGVPKATGSDGSTVTLEGGGVVRMTIDGRELEVFSSGTRNHLDVAMNSLDDIFTYDNTDDGLGWWTRFTHHVPTGYYGYPFDYLTRPERHLPAISEHGGGSPVGADCYRESVWPESMREAAFHCEWGKRSVQCFRLQRDGATYRAQMTDFLVPEEGSEFRPQDLCFSPDGRFMYVADWQFGGWTQDQQVGRLYRVAYVGDGQTAAAAVSEAWDPSSDLETAISRLGDRSYSVRRLAQDRVAAEGRVGLVALQRAFASDTLSPTARVHGIWAAATIAESGAVRIMGWLAGVATTDDDGDVRAQAARAIGMLATRRMPSIVTVSEHEYREREPVIDDGELAQAVSVLTRVAIQDGEPRARLQGIVALGRAAMPGSFPAMASRLADIDPTVRFVARRALRSQGGWSEGLEAAGAPSAFTSQLVLAAVGVFDEEAVKLLASVAEKGETPSVRAAAIAALSEVHRRSDRYESGWWGTRPAAGPPGRAPQHVWSGSSMVVEAIQKALRSEAPEERLAAIESLVRVEDEGTLALLRERIADVNWDEASRRRGIEILGNRKDAASVEMLADLAEAAESSQELRDVAVAAIRAIGGETGARRLAGMVGREDTPATTLVAALEAIAAMDLKEGRSAVARRLHHEDATVRGAAIRTLAVLEGAEATGRLLPGLDDEVLEVRLAAIESLGKIRAGEAVTALLAAAAKDETRVAASFALLEIGDRAALSVFLAALVDRNPQLRERAGARLLALRGEVIPELRALAERNELQPEVRRELATLFARPEPVMQWWLAGAWDQRQESPDGAIAEAPNFEQPIRVGDLEFAWQQVQASDEGVVDPGRFVSPNSNVWADAVALVTRERAGKVAWTVGSDDQAILWINGEKQYEYLGNRGYSPEQGSGEVELREGLNVIRLRTGNASGPWQFGMRLGVSDPELAFLESDLTPAPDLATYRDFAMQNAGDVERGKAVFFAAEGIGCAKCHAVGKEGMADIGPNLLGVGAKYPRDELIRSVLEPSNRIFSGYEMTVVETESGEVIQGVVRSESETEVVLGDARGELIRVAVETIVHREKSERSAMPEGLEKGLSVEEFADLVAYLESLKSSE